MSEEIKIEEPKAMSVLDKISMLSDLANAARDDEIVRLMKSKPNGEKLYGLFVKAVSDEIEVLMNGASVTVPKSIASAGQMAEQVFQICNRLGQLMGAIEQGPTIQVLQMFLQNLGGGRQMPPPQQQQQQRQVHEQSEEGQMARQAIEQANSNRGGRGGINGSF